MRLYSVRFKVVENEYTGPQLERYVVATNMQSAIEIAWETFGKQHREYAPTQTYELFHISAIEGVTIAS